jgi:hypothetical protein
MVAVTLIPAIALVVLADAALRVRSTDAPD